MSYTFLPDLVPNYGKSRENFDLSKNNASAVNLNKSWSTVVIKKITLVSVREVVWWKKYVRNYFKKIAFSAFLLINLLSKHLASDK